MRKKSHEDRLLEFLGKFYDKQLPYSDEGLFCLLEGVMMAKECCRMTYMTTKANFMDFLVKSSIHKKIKHEEKVRIRLYNEAYNLVSSYIVEVKGFRRNSREFSKWFDEMYELFNENKEEYTKQIKLEAGKILNVVFDHLMKKEMHSETTKN